jgi:histidyl-tRNA synthetase
MLTQRPRGTADILPGEVEMWQRLESIVRETFQTYGYKEIRTPMFEHTELFARGVGETSDIVEKEMYTFLDRGGRSITLRPEGTAGVVRAYVENKLYAAAGVTKLYYLGPMFRYEKPQKGRFRQFHQIGVEALGSDDPALDAEVVALSVDVLQRLGITGVTVELNSVGCAACRPIYRERLISALQPHADRLCEDCQSRLERNPLRVLDCKRSACRAVLADIGLPTIRDTLCEACSAHFGQVQTLLDVLGVPWVLNDRLVRGLDYYTRTAWEVTLPDHGTILGGGRYNGLVAEVGGPETPGIGFAGGVERILLALRDQQGDQEATERTGVFVAVADEQAVTPAVRLLQQLRAKGLVADRDYQGRSLKSQLKAADRFGARYAAILGEAELAKGVVTVKDLTSGDQAEVPIDEAAGILAERMGLHGE